MESYRNLLCLFFGYLFVQQENDRLQFLRFQTVTQIHHKNPTHRHTLESGLPVTCDESGLPVTCDAGGLPIRCNASVLPVT